MISAVCNIPRRSSPCCASHLGDDFCTQRHSGVQHTIERISAVCSIPQKSSQRCATDCGDDLRGEQHTAEINCTPRKQNLILHLSMVAFKDTIRKKSFRGEHIYQERTDLKYSINVDLLRKCFDLSSVLHTTEITL